MSKYSLVYLEKGKDNFTIDDLPDTCDTFSKSKARACMMFVKAFHTKDIFSLCDGSFADLVDDEGNVLVSLFRIGDRSWVWKS